MISLERTVYVQTRDAEISAFGLFMYGDASSGEESLLAFYRDFSAGHPIFDNCTGCYRVLILYSDGRRVYFSDNSGMMKYYINQKTSQFYSTLDDSMPREERIPNLPAIAQFLYYGCIYGLETPIKGVVCSDPELYYEVRQGDLISKPKGLTSMEKLGLSGNALELQMQRFAREFQSHESLACTITGGVDSRSVLAHLLHNGVYPVLDITGHDGQSDVDIAKTIAHLTNLELLHITDEPEGENWIDEAIYAADGMTGVCGSYRLYKKAKALHAAGITMECGGAAGELYKNSFINQDFPLYYGVPRWTRFFKLKMATADFPLELCGERIVEDMCAVPQKTLAWLSSHSGKNKANAYLSAGYQIMQSRITGLSFLNARWYTHYNPLLERSVAASSFNKNPYSLEMQAFQREQVSKFYPLLKDIPTDRGLTCNEARKGCEFLKSFLFLLRIAAKRIFCRSRMNTRIDPCFAKGLASVQYNMALTRCKEMGIIAESAEHLPWGIADRVFAIGTIL